MYTELSQFSISSSYFSIRGKGEKQISSKKYFFLNFLSFLQKNIFSFLDCKLQAAWTNNNSQQAQFNIPSSFLEYVHLHPFSLADCQGEAWPGERIWHKAWVSSKPVVIEEAVLTADHIL